MAASPVEWAVRDAYGRVLAYLASRVTRWEDAEDALSDAIVVALRDWTRNGIPERPEAWLLTVARRRLADQTRKNREVAIDLESLERIATESDDMTYAFPEERLKLLFFCAHPAIDPSARTPLMLQVVLGVDAPRIAGSFLVTPSAMAQRIVRAKARLREVGAVVELPTGEEFRRRLPYVLSAIYAAFNLGWEEGPTLDGELWDLADEAVHLAEIVADGVPSDPETLGLAALCLYMDARRGARRDANGHYVPLSKQDPLSWDLSKIMRAESHLLRASQVGQPARYQLEAAIQSAHCARMMTGTTDWVGIVQLYKLLLYFAPSVGARVGHAAAVAESGNVPEALDLLERSQAPSDYLPSVALRADLLARMERREEARHYYTCAIGLARDPEVRRFLIARREKN